MKTPFLTGSLLLLSMPALLAQVPAFPGAEGFGAQATGGRGGQVIYVTNTQVTGPGSLQEALDTPGPRYIVFNCSGVIDGAVFVPPGGGDFTLAGQTSPSGIVVRGLEAYQDQGHSMDNFIIRHLRSRVGNDTLFPTQHPLIGDGITLGGAHNGIVDHCSFGHAGDEAVDISRSSRLSIQNCLLAETLGEHGYLGGMLLNYSGGPANNLDSLTIHHNCWNRIGGRMPEFSCEAPECDQHTLHAELSSNLYWDPQIESWYNASIVAGGNTNTFYLGLNIQNNYYYARTGYTNGMYNHSMLENAPNSLYVSGNRMNLYPAEQDYDLFYCCNDFNLSHPNTDPGVCTHLSTAWAYPPVTATTALNLPAYMYAQAGAFPRDPMDQRLMNPVNTGTLVNLPVNQAGAQDPFTTLPAAAAPADADLDGMPDYWETAHGLNPAVQDHNGTQLSVQITGVSGYTNLECYLNCLSDARIQGSSTALCGIQISRDTPEMAAVQVHIYPNPSQGSLHLRATWTDPALRSLPLVISDLTGRELYRSELQRVGHAAVQEWDAADLELPAGMYLVRAGNQTLRWTVE